MSAKTKLKEEKEKHYFSFYKEEQDFSSQKASINKKSINLIKKKIINLQKRFFKQQTKI